MDKRGGVVEKVSSQEEIEEDMYRVREKDLKKEKFIISTEKSRRGRYTLYGAYE